MSLAGFTDATLGTTASVGRYFATVSVLPSVLFVAWLFILGATGAWTGTPDVGRVPSVVAGLGLTGALGLIAASLAVALALHPVQFLLVQMMEGYWGTSRAARTARLARSRVHVRTLLRSEQLQFDAAKQRRAHGIDPTSIEDVLSPEGLQNTPGRARLVLETAIALETGSTLRGSYPDKVGEVMPTRLGNALRRYESRAGAGYGLSILDHAPGLVMVAKPEHVQYLNDQRSSLDLAVRMSAMSVLAAAITVVTMVPHGAWLSVALVPYTVAWLCYRGSVTVAVEYGRALVAFTDLNRFRLYEELRLGVPATPSEEIAKNKAWGRVRHGVVVGGEVVYDRPPPTSGRMRLHGVRPVAIRRVAGMGRTERARDPQSDGPPSPTVGS